MLGTETDSNSRTNAFLGHSQESSPIARYFRAIFVQNRSCAVPLVMDSRYLSLSSVTAWNFVSDVSEAQPIHL